MAELEKEIIILLQKIRPYLQRDGGDLRFVSIENDIVYVELLGACEGCASSHITLKEAVEAIIVEEFPNIKRVEKI